MCNNKSEDERNEREKNKRETRRRGAGRARKNDEAKREKKVFSADEESTRVSKRNREREREKDGGRIVEARERKKGSLRKISRGTAGRILFRLVKILMSVGPGLFNDACISTSVHEARPWQV